MSSAPGVSLDGDLLPVAVRCYMEPVPEEEKQDRPRRRRSGGRKPKPRPTRMLVIDCETLTQETLDNPDKMPGFDPDEWPAYAQPLLLGTAHLWTRRANSRKWRRTYEWTFYPDNLPSPTLTRLRRHFNRDNRRMGDWREPTDAPGVKAYLLPLSEFLTVFYREAVSRPCLITGFNLPFDLSRLAFKAGPAKSRRFRGGFSFGIWPDPTGKHSNNLYRPRLYIKQLGQRSTLMAFSMVKLGPGKDVRVFMPPAELLDLSQLTTALLGEPHTLDRACEALGLMVRKAKTPLHGILSLAYFRYNRHDTIITAELAFAALDRFDKHPVSRAQRTPGPLSECSVYSGASIAKAYLKLMGVRPRLESQPDFPKRVLAATMEAYYGGRTESRLWGVPVPVAPLDFTSMYPTVADLQRLWPIITAQSIEVVECAESVRSLLETVEPSDLFDRHAWPELNGFVRIRPHGDILPVRARYQDHGSTWKIGCNPYYANQGQWFALADLVASRVRGGPIPEVLEAFRLVPGDPQPDLTPVDFAGTLTIDPNHDNFFSNIVEERARIQAKLPPYNRTSDTELEAASLALKIMANAGAYGIFAEINIAKLASGQSQTVNLWSANGSKGPPQPLTTAFPESGGYFFFPPLAALITAGARLFLALLEQAAESRGASYALCDTDSMYLTYRPDGGLLTIPGADGPVRLLTDGELEEILAPFNRLNPYDQRVVPSLLKREYADRGPLRVLSIAPKRYAVFTADGKVIARSESALGAIIPTPGSPATDGGIHRHGSRPDWITAWWEAIVSGSPLPFAAGPLVRKYSVQTWETLNHFRELNRGKPYQAQVKPFNFLITAQPDPLLAPSDTGPLVAPFTPDPEAWASLAWYETHTGHRVSVTLDPERAATAANHAVCVSTIASYFDHYRCFRPSEFRLPSDGVPGLLKLRPVQRSSLTLIGKESAALVELAEAGLIGADPYQVSEPDGAHWIESLRPVLADLPSSARSELCARLGVDARTVRRWGDGSRLPENRFRLLIEGACFRFAGEVCEARGIVAPAHPANAIALYASLAPAIKADILAWVGTSIQQVGTRATARRLGIDRDTIQTWTANADRIPLDRAILAVVSAPPQLDPLKVGFSSGKDK